MWHKISSLHHNSFVSSFQRRPNCSQFKAVQQVLSFLSTRLPTLAEVVKSFTSGHFLDVIFSGHCINHLRDPDIWEWLATGHMKEQLSSW